MKMTFKRPAGHHLPGCALSLLLLVAAPRASAIVADRFAAQVNAHVITVSDVLGAMGPIRQHLMETYSGADLDNKLEDVFQKTLDQLIERALILEDFSRQEQKMPDQIVDSRINEIIHDRFNNNRAAFFDALTEEHLTIEEWRSEAKDHMIISMLRRREVADKVVIAPGDVRARYEKTLKKYQTPEQVHLRVIVLHSGTTAIEKDNRRRQAEELRQRLLKGETFDELAKKFSEGQHAAEGGDWGWMPLNELRSDLSTAINSLADGSISPVIAIDTTPQGENAAAVGLITPKAFLTPSSNDFYILKLEERKAAAVKPFETVYGELEAELRQIEAERIYKDWIKRLKLKYFIKIFPLS